MWLIITKYQNHDPLACQLLVPAPSLLSLQLSFLFVVILNLLFEIFCLLLFCLVFSFSKCVSVSETIDLLPSISLLLCPAFLSHRTLSYMLFLITSRRVTSPLPSNQLHSLTSKQLHFRLADMNTLKLRWLTSLPWAQNIFIKTESSSHFLSKFNSEPKLWHFFLEILIHPTYALIDLNIVLFCAKLHR